MTIKSNNKNLNCLIDPTFTKVNRLFVLSFARIARENNTTKDHRDSFSNCYVPNVEIDGKSLFDLSVKNKEESFEKIMEMSRNSDYTTGNLLDFGYFKENCTLIATDLSK